MYTNTFAQIDLYILYCSCIQMVKDPVSILTDGVELDQTKDIQL